MSGALGAEGSRDEAADELEGAARRVAAAA
jgi:hypothetical protein